MEAVFFVDGDRLLMVAIELCMSLFALVYAFPHIPERLLHPGGSETTWISVLSHEQLVAAALALLHESPVLRVCADEIKPESLASLGTEVFSDPVLHGVVFF